MSAGAEYLDERNAQATAERLEKAAAFVRIHAKSPLFQKRMGRYLVRVEWPGVLIVADPETLWCSPHCVPATEAAGHVVDLFAAMF